jgi:hypothetical protein
MGVIWSASDRIEITRTNSLVTLRFSGAVLDDDFRQGARGLSAIVADSPDIHELVDLRAVTSFEVTTATIAAAAQSAPRFSEKSRQAFVAPRDVVYGLMRMYSILAEQQRPNLQVFRDMDEARKWLGIATPWIEVDSPTLL